jgi:hypothetical protein
MGLFRLLKATTCLSFGVVGHAAAISNASYTLGDPEVVLPQGIIQGSLDSYNNSVYLGIPYAQTTGGQNRYAFTLDPFRRLIQY